ncbi:MAG: phage portal protein [Sulfuricaulis sp.]|nr:phage portal protein [Sulfuricaulis sp.]
MATKSLIAAIAAGVRPLSIRAGLEKWLGVPVTLQDHAFWREWGGSGGFTGKRVTVDQALQLSTASACVRLIAETLATLPLGFYRRNSDGSRTAATSHNLYNILHNQPNNDMTAVVFWEVVVASLLLWGNAYIEIFRIAGVVAALNFLHPARMTVTRLLSGAYEYRYRDGATERVIPDTDLMHVPAFSIDGVMGLSPIAYGANVFSTAIETDRASAETFRDSTRASGIVTVDALLKSNQRDEIRAHVKKVSTEGGVYVLEKGAGFENLKFNPVDAETLASRAWNAEEIARWFRVDPAMIGHGGKDSNWGTGLEQKMIWFLTFTLRHWCVRIEQAVRKCLLTPAERQTYFAAFSIEGLLRADSTARAAFYSSMVNVGIYTRDECRQLENLAPKGGNAAVLTVQSAMVDIDHMNEGTNAAAQGAQDALKAWLGIETPSASTPKE